MAIDLDQRLTNGTGTTATGDTRWRRLWWAAWPRVAAAGVVVAVWQALVWTHWRSPNALAPPGDALRSLQHSAATAAFWEGIDRTLRRAVAGYTAAVVIGCGAGLTVARLRLLRTATGSMITGLQTMPSIAWFPLAILLLGQSEAAILFVVVLGAAPSFANGIIAGVDHVPPILLRAGHVVGARGVHLYRHVIIPAALPSIVSGLKQGWAFAWRSLMAGELIVTVPGHASIGSRLAFARQNSDAPGVVAMMITILAVGVVVDALFGRLDLSIRRRRGLVEAR